MKRSKKVVPLKEASSLGSQQPTRESVIAEARGLGSEFGNVTERTSDLITEAGQMLRARGDAPELFERGYNVTDAMFARVEILSGMLVPFVARKMQAVADRRERTERSGAVRGELLAIRERIANIADAAGIPTEKFSIGKAQSQGLNNYLDAMSAVLDNALTHRREMPDHSALDQLMNRGRALIGENKQSRSESEAIVTSRKSDTATVGQLKRLLLDTLRHLSKQGLAAYPGDIERQNAYRLEVIAARTAKKPGAPEPVVV